MPTVVIACIAGAIGMVAGATAVAALRPGGRGDDTGEAIGPQPVELPTEVVSVLAVLPSSAVVIDAADQVVRASSAARAFGLVCDDRLVIPELSMLAHQVRRDGEIRETTIERPSERLGREPTTFAVRVAPLGAEGLVLVLAEDQTESRRVEALRRDFVANVSHELKTPVGALSLLAETVEAAADDPVAVRRFAGRMQREAARLINVVQDVITLSQVQDGEPIAEPRPVPVDEVVADALDRCRMNAQAGGIELVSSGETGLWVSGGDELLKTALRNLVANAIAYSPADTRVVVARRRDSVDGDTVEISVTDQGIGIPERDLERVFERFYRVDAARSRATGGTGLGLAIVKHVATTHGGRVAVWSKEGSGSTFTLTLPISDVREPAVAGARGSPEGRK